MPIPFPLRLAVFILASACSMTLWAGDEAASVFETVSPNVFTVLAKRPGGVAAGSGVVVDYGKIATNYHVVRDALQIRVVQGGAYLDAELEAKDEQRDLALLRVEGLSATPVVFGNSTELKVGQNVYAVGSPRGLELSLSTGIVSSLRATRQGTLIQTTAPISQGSSGGGLFDREGRLLGLTTMQVVDGQNLNFAIPVEWLSVLGVAAASTGTLPPASTGARTPPIESVGAAAERPPVSDIGTAQGAGAPERKSQPPSRTRLIFWLLVPFALLALAKPAIHWLTELLSRAPETPGVSSQSASRLTAEQRLEPYRRIARDELKNGQRDAGAWIEALEKSGGVENKAIAAYVELRAQSLRKTELDQKWAKAVADSRNKL